MNVWDSNPRNVHYITFYFLFFLFFFALSFLKPPNEQNQADRWEQSWWGDCPKPPMLPKTFLDSCTRSGKRKKKKEKRKKGVYYTRAETKKLSKVEPASRPTSWDFDFLSTFLSIDISINDDSGGWLKKVEITLFFFCIRYVFVRERKECKNATFGIPLFPCFPT